MTNNFELTTTYEEQSLRPYDTSFGIRVLSSKGSWIFDIINEHSVSITNNITDNFLENGTAVQDSITHNPITVTVSGLKGELVFPNNGQWFSIHHATQKDNSFLNKLDKIPNILPVVNNLKQQNVQTFKSGLGKTTKYLNIITDFLDKSKFENEYFLDFFDGEIDYSNTRIYQTYQNLKRLQEENLPFIVVTPFNTFENMYIQNINFSQGDSNYIANISINFKQINFSNTQYTKTNTDRLNEIADLQRQEETNEGKAQGELKSIAYEWFHSKDK